MLNNSACLDEIQAYRCMQIPCLVMGAATMYQPTVDYVLQFTNGLLLSLLYCADNVDRTTKSCIKLLDRSMW